MSSQRRPPALRRAIATLPATLRQYGRTALDEHGPWRLGAVALLLLLIASPWWPLTLLTLAAYLAVTVQRPGLTVALLPLAMPFAYLPKPVLGVDGPQFPVVELLLVIAVLTSGVQLVVRWRRHQRAGNAAAVLLDAWDTFKEFTRRPFGSHALALAALATFSLFTVADPAHRHESLREYRTIVIEPLIYFFLARYWLRDRALRQIAIGALLAGATIVALLALGQVLTGSQVVVAGGVRRARAVYQHPNHLALYFDRIVPFALALLLIRPHGRPRGRATGWLLGVAALTVLGLVLTFSRGAFLGVAVALAALALLSTDRAVRVGILGTLIVGGLLALVGSQRLVSLGGGGGSVDLRQFIWGSTLAMIRDHPAFGVGLDQFLYQYAPRYINPAAWSERYTAHPHNFLLDFWVRLGIMGVAWIAWLLASLGAWFARRWRERHQDRQLTSAVAVACLAAVAHGLVDNFYFLIDLAFIWWFLLALAQAGATPLPAGDRRDTPPQGQEGW